jgi:hypothetical protein
MSNTYKERQDAVEYGAFARKRIAELEAQVFRAEAIRDDAVAERDRWHEMYRKAVAREAALYSVLAQRQTLQVWERSDRITPAPLTWDVLDRRANAILADTSPAARELMELAEAGRQMVEAPKLSELLAKGRAWDRVRSSFTGDTPADFQTLDRSDMDAILEEERSR